MFSLSRICTFALIVFCFTLASLTCSSAEAGFGIFRPVVPFRGPNVAFRQGFNQGVRNQAFRQGFNAGNGGSAFIGSPFRSQFIGSPFRQQFIGGPVFVPHQQFVPVVPQSFGFFAF